MKIVSGRQSLVLAKKLALSLKAELVKTDLKTLSDGDIYARVGDGVKNVPYARETVIVCQGGGPPTNESLVELLLLLDAVDRQKPKKLIALIPFSPYRRQDKINLPGEALSAQVVAKVLEVMPVDRFIFVDLHALAILDFFTKPVTHVSALPLFSRVLAPLVSGASDEWLVVAPDEGAKERAKALAESLGVNWLMMIKKRGRAMDKISSLTFKKSVAGKNCVIFDDEIKTGGTMATAAQLLKQRGAKKIIAAATHGLFVGEAVKLLSKSPISKFYVTDSVNINVNLPITRLSLAPLLTEVILSAD